MDIQRERETERWKQTATDRQLDRVREREGERKREIM